MAPTVPVRIVEGEVNIQAELPAGNEHVGEVTIVRKHGVETLTMADNAAITTDSLDMREYAGADVHIPAGWVAANCGFARATTDNVANAVRMRTDDGTLLQITGIVADQAYQFPTGSFSGHYIWLLSQDAAGANVNQTGGPLSFEVEKKS